MSQWLRSGPPSKKYNHHYNCDVESLLWVVVYVAPDKWGRRGFKWENSWARTRAADLRAYAGCCCSQCTINAVPAVPKRWEGVRESVLSGLFDRDAMKVYSKMLDIKSAAIQEVPKRP